MPDRNEEYAGPRFDTTICNKISEELKERGKNVTSGTVEGVIGTFFRHFLFAMRKREFIRLKFLGEFGPSKKTLENMYAIMEQNRDMRVLYIRAKGRVAAKRKRIRKGFNAFNEFRASKGLKPYTLKEYLIIKKIEYPKKISKSSVLRKKIKEVPL